jgi:regulator of sirC expression with transglutaminase-like and TPR domain
LIVVDATDRFARLVATGAGELDELAFLLAAHARPTLSVPDELARLDRLAAEIGPSDPAGVCRVLFGSGRFTGNSQAYDDPRNSFLDRVLSRRTGIPITLSILAIEVGRRCGAHLVGIGMPGHFLVRDADDDDSFFDPFMGGVPLGPEGCAARFHQLHPTGVFTDGMLPAVTNVQIVSRMLANLTRSYLQSSDVPNLLWVLRLRTVLPDASVALRRQYAGVLANAGRFWEGADQYELLAVEQPDRADQHHQAATRLRARLN